MRQLDRTVAADFLTPQRAGHAVDERLAVGREREARWSAGQLRQVHLAEVVVVRQIDLLQHRLALGESGGREREGQRGTRSRDQSTAKVVPFDERVERAS